MLQAQEQQRHMAQGDYKAFFPVFPGRAYFIPEEYRVVMGEFIELH